MHTYIHTCIDATNFMVPFYAHISTKSRLQSYYEDEDRDYFGRYIHTKYICEIYI